jgi:hypothetical protein
MPLDWTEEGMTGQPAGAYLEALRQAAVLRNGVQYTTAGAPGAIATSEHGVVRLAALLLYIDTAAWYLGDETYWGWLSPSAITDISGEATWNAWPAVMQTEADLLAAADLPYRMVPPWLLKVATPSEDLLIAAWWEWLAAVAGVEAEPTSDFEHYRGEWLCGPLSGAYLRQLRAVFLAKRVWSEYGDLRITPAAVSVRYGSATAPFPEMPMWANAAADLVARPWASGVTGRAGWQARGGIPAYGQDGYINITRIARRIIWGIKSPGGCQHVTAYLYAGPYRKQYLNNDYPTMQENAWSKYIDDQARDYAAADWIGLIDDPGTEPPGGLPYFCGWELLHQYAVMDYRSDWTELA